MGAFGGWYVDWARRCTAGARFAAREKIRVAFIVSLRWKVWNAGLAKMVVVLLEKRK